jgi:HEAT repeat protein
LGEFGPKAVALVPALMARLKDDEKGPEQGSVVFVRAAAARTLGRIGTGAHLAVPQLKDLLSESESYLRMEATIALWRITRETDQTLPPLLNLLATTPDDSKWEIFLALGEMGPAAKSAVPVIISELKSTDAFVRQRAAESLHKIDPSQLPEVTPSTQPVTQHQ